MYKYHHQINKISFVKLLTPAPALSTEGPAKNLRDSDHRLVQERVKNCGIDELAPLRFQTWSLNQTFLSLIQTLSLKIFWKHICTFLKMYDSDFLSLNQTFEVCFKSDFKSDSDLKRVWFILIQTSSLKTEILYFHFIHRF